MVSLTQIQEVPPKKSILLVGPPGAGKSAFCEQTVLQSLAMNRPIIFVTTNSNPTEIEKNLRERGLGKVDPDLLNFIDAFNETVGVSVSDRPDTVRVDCGNLSSIDIAISKLSERIERKDVLLVFNSLTSPYLFSGSEILRFMRLTLSKFAAEGNSVLACIDEGCGKSEDLVAMMSIVDGILKIELMGGSKTLNVMKHPKLEPTKIEVPMAWSPAISYHMDTEMLTQHIAMTMGLMAGPLLRTEVGDYVNLFWPNFARWSAMPQDPKRFPTMNYNYNKQVESMTREEFIQFLPWRTRFFLKFMPKNFSKVKDMKKVMSRIGDVLEGDRSNILEYLENDSKTDEHYMRGYEGATCWGFENVGATLGLGGLGGFAGFLKGFEKEDRDWNVVETKCIGLGDSYCEVKVVPGEIDELRGSLEALDNTIMERIHDRLMDRLMGFMLHEKPLWDRPSLGNEISLHTVSHFMVLPAIASERYRTAMRLGGAMGGKKVSEHLMDAGIREDEAIQHVLNLLEHCKVGKVTIDETIRIRENCESFMIKAEEPSCYFTTGFLNGVFSAVRNQHVKETKCIAVGDSYCEWEFR